ncbi:hypothetical protein QQ045_017872 [Rhodiola kirilowii]
METHTKSFRNKDYNSRMVFLRSYPLHWGDEEDEQDYWPGEKARKKSYNIKSMKKMVLAAMEWSEDKLLILKRLKHKVALYVVACIPKGFKNTTALISTK